MKIKNLLFVLMLAPVLLAGCKKDKETDHAADIAGEYKGTVKVAENPVANDVIINVERTGTNKVKVSLNQNVMNLSFDINKETDVKTDKDGYPSIETTASINLTKEALLALPGLSDVLSGALALFPGTSIDVPAEISGNFKPNTKGGYGAYLTITLKAPTNLGGATLAAINFEGDRI